jgi:hypothetical protein
MSLQQKTWRLFQQLLDLAEIMKLPNMEQGALSHW